MSTRPKSKFPIESFGPELMEFLLKVGRGATVTLSFPRRKDATRFRMRVHMLRQRMREADHPEYKMAAKARLSLHWENGKGPNDPATLVGKPFDSEFADILKTAGVGAPELKTDPLNEV